MVLRELGGADYVPPTIASLADGEDGMGMRMGGQGHGQGQGRTRMRTAQPRVIIRTGDHATPEISYHATKGYRFQDLLSDCCDFFGVPVDEFEPDTNTTSVVMTNL